MVGSMRRAALVAAALLAVPLAPLFRQVPEPGIGSVLQGVYCTSRASCWAVGSYRPAPKVSLSEILRWKGSTWVRVAAPSPGGTANGDVSQLSAVRCARARDCWAVGSYQSGAGAIFSLALHWTGRKWFRVPTPQLGGSRRDDITQLDDVACTSSASCWAVGFFGTNTGQIIQRNEALHWNGRKWSQVAAPNPAGTARGDFNDLNSVRCPSARTCLAVGVQGTISGASITNLNEALRWNGTRWSELSVPDPGGTSAADLNGLGGLACSSPRNCWAVGAYGSFTPPAGLFNQVLHWNGHAWSQVTVPEPSGSEDFLAFVACGSATDCWAVGTRDVATGDVETSFNQAMHWDGGMWTLVDTPDPAGTGNGDFNALSGVRCTSRSNCWAVGSTTTMGGSSLGQVQHWDGTGWSVR